MQSPAAPSLNQRLHAIDVGRTFHLEAPFKFLFSAGARPRIGRQIVLTRRRLCDSLRKKIVFTHLEDDRQVRMKVIRINPAM